MSAAHRLQKGASKKFVATEILSFDFELFTGGLFQLVAGCRREHKHYPALRTTHAEWRKRYAA